MKLKRDSQIYKFLQPWEFDEPDNFCSLMIQVILFPLFLIAAGAFVGSILVFGIAGFVLWAIFGLFDMAFFGQFSLILSSVLIAVGIVLAILRVTDPSWHSEAVQIVSEAYHEIKDRYCPLVKWE